MRDLHKVLLIGSSSRILVLALFVLFGFLFGCSSAQAGLYLSNPLPVVNLFNPSDSIIYIDIAKGGYPISSNPALPRPEWAFFPFYPATMKAASVIFTPFMSSANAVELAGFIISNAAFFLSIFFFYKLTNKIFNKPQIALAATAFYSFWAGSIVYSAVLSESLFMALLIGAFYFLEEDKLQYAVPLGFLAAFTRSDGFLACIPFLVYALQSYKNRPKTLKLLASSAFVAAPFLIFQIVGYEVAGHVFPITVLAHNLNWQIYPFVTTQFGIFLSDSTSLSAFYIMGLALIFLPTAYFISRLFFKPIKNSLIQESKQLKYWVFYASMAFVILFQSFICSTLRYAVPMLPIYWVSALIYSKNRAVGLVLFGVMTAMLIFSAYLLETGGRFM